MKIVIDIPEEDYRQIKECYEKNDIVEATYSYIYHGTPLPEHHGRLIDADAITKDVKTLQNSFVINMDYMTGKILGCECLAPTIIEGSDNNDT